MSAPDVEMLRKSVGRMVATSRIRARESVTLHIAQRVNRILERQPFVRPMQQKKVDLTKPQMADAVLDRALKQARREIVGRDFGHDENLLALDAGCTHALADLAFVPVHLRGVEMPIAELDRLFDDPHTVAPVQSPGAKAHGRNAAAFGFDELHDECPLVQSATTRMTQPSRAANR